MTFTPNIPAAGTYDVYGIWVAGTGNATNAPIQINYSQGTATAYADEKNTTTSKVWVWLGTYTFNAGTGGTVTYQTTGTNGNANGTVYVDGMRYVRVK